MRRSGIDLLGAVPWGSHFCLFYERLEDLTEILVPYFRQGLEQNECCVWVVSERLEAEGARAALQAAVPDLETYLQKGQLTIIDSPRWYGNLDQFEADRILGAWLAKEREALERGYEGLRISGDAPQLGLVGWRAFSEYEARVNSQSDQHRMIILCTYAGDRYGIPELVEVVGNHEFALVKQAGRWQVIENREHRRTEEELRKLNESLEQRVIERTALAEQRASQLRVLASELTLAEERERHRVARILHDQLQQLLVTARLKVSGLRRRVQDAGIIRVAEEIDELIDQSIQESRLLTTELSPPVLYDGGLAAGLQWLARQMEKKHGLPVTVHAAPASEPAEESLRVFLFQAVRGLLLNVTKHAQADAASLELKALRDDQLQLIVADTGVGFGSAWSEGQGRLGGFGLFSIRERLEVLGGRLEVKSSPGQGTRVIIEVPLACRPPVPVNMAMATVRAIRRIDAEHRAEEPLRPPRQAKIRVVLADDHAILRRGLAGVLGQHPQMEVVGEAGNGQEAIETALKTRPDVVLMDITMPVLNGIEATRQIVEALPGTRVIGLSMHEDEDMAAAMQRAGAVAYLRKDVASGTLIQTILGQEQAI